VTDAAACLELEVVTARAPSSKSISSVNAANTPGSLYASFNLEVSLGLSPLPPPAVSLPPTPPYFLHSLPPSFSITVPPSLSLSPYVLPSLPLRFSLPLLLPDCEHATNFTLTYISRAPPKIGLTKWKQEYT